MSVEFRTTGSWWRYWGIMVMRSCTEIYLGPVKVMLLPAGYSVPPSPTGGRES